MLNLPSSTIFNKRIPKQKFYNHLPVTSKIVKLFTDQIDSVYWAHKLAPDTINLEPGLSVSEIQVLQIELKSDQLDESVVSLIDREIPYHFVFVVSYKGYGQLWIAHKEEAKNREGKFKVNRYFTTEWLPLEQLTLKIEGINLDQVYEGFVIQIAGDELVKEDEENLTSAVKRSEEISYLRWEISRLENRMRIEKQFNRQVKLYREIRDLGAELNRLENREG